MNGPSSATLRHDAQPHRLELLVSGAVQGVGFRPFVYRLARDLALRGHVQNTPQGVLIVVEGGKKTLASFAQRLTSELPPLAHINEMDARWSDPAGEDSFSIQPSSNDGLISAEVLPDSATCPECLREILDPRDRRYRYPFTNCMHCGPRFTIIHALPYDRANTAMRGFSMCAACQTEYEDPTDRRFHAQPIACPECGPQLALWTAEGRVLAQREDALLGAASAIRRGDIVAIKGLGGFHLVVDASNDRAVAALRRRKQREGKPLAVMCLDMRQARELVAEDSQAEQLLRSPEAPIVLLERRARAPIADAVAPENPYLGVFLPYTPLHHLLLAECDGPVVATSGNLHDEPMCIDNLEALSRLGKIADFFLVHDRPILRHMDDSIVRVVAGRAMVLRRTRGFAPAPVHVTHTLPPTLAVGAHLKNTVALAQGKNVFLSQHIGDLETPLAYAALGTAAQDLQALYACKAETVATDLHPDYLSTRYAETLGLSLHPVQHHVAHMLSCMADNGLEGPALGFSWDGAGLGSDGTVWGGETFMYADGKINRFAHLLPFPLPGGDAAAREPRRSALGLLYRLDEGDVSALLPALAAGFHGNESAILLTMLEREVNCPMTSSMGRLFDGVAALLGIRTHSAYEGEAAMLLEFAAKGSRESEHLEIPILGSAPPYQLDWRPMIRALLLGIARGASTASLARGFHEALVRALVELAKRAALPDVVLTGGCFQNTLLTELAIAALTENCFVPHWHRQVPPNDGGIALGQAVASCYLRASDATNVPQRTKG